MGSISVDELENLNLPMAAPKQISVDSAENLGHSDPYTYAPPLEPRSVGSRGEPYVGPPQSPV